MNIRKLFKQHRKSIITAVIVTLATIVAFILAHNAATAEREYKAIGGEIFVLLIPYMCGVAYKNAKGTKKELKGAEADGLD